MEFDTTLSLYLRMIKLLKENEHNNDVTGKSIETDHYLRLF